jgi:hypothetical protein
LILQTGKPPASRLGRTQAGNVPRVAIFQVLFERQTAVYGGERFGIQARDRGWFTRLNGEDGPAGHANYMHSMAPQGESDDDHDAVWSQVPGQQGSRAGI